MRPCKFETDETRELIARQMAEFMQNGKSVEHYPYLAKSEYNTDPTSEHRRPDGTLSGKVNSKLFDR